MKKYLSFFRMRFIAGLQYRAAAVAGIATQFVWGFMEILLFRAFYEADATAFPMSFEALASYIWLQQAFLVLFMGWFLENEIFQSISDGSIAYELCRPVQIYPMLFSRSTANRLSKAVLRCLPILVIAAFLPRPYRLSLPVNAEAAFWFIVSMLFSFLIAVAFGMIIYIITFYTISPLGLRIVVMNIVEFFSGGILPLPFFPDKIRQVVELLPFASMQNIPLRIYSGDIMGDDILFRIGLQFFWLAAIVLLGKSLMQKALRRVIVQGG